MCVPYLHVMWLALFFVFSGDFFSSLGRLLPLKMIIWGFCVSGASGVCLTSDVKIRSNGLGIGYRRVSEMEGWRGGVVSLEIVVPRLGLFSAISKMGM